MVLGLRTALPDVAGQNIPGSRTGGSSQTKHPFPTRLGKARPGRTHSRQRPKRDWWQKAQISSTCLWFMYLKFTVLEDPAHGYITVHS